MDKPWIVLVAGIVSLLAVGLAVQRALRPSDDETARIASQVAAKAGERGGARSGWAAREGGPNEPGAGSEAANEPGGGRRGRATGRNGGQSSDSDAAASGGRAGSATIVSGGGAAGGSVGVGSGRTVLAPGGIEFGTTGIEGGPFKGAKSASDVRMRSGTTETVTGTGRTDTNNKTGTDQDDDLIVSLPLKNGSLEAEKGDSPVVAEGVTFDGGNLRFSTDSQFVLPNAGNIEGDAGTISFCIDPEWKGGEDTSAAFVDVRAQNVFENRIQIDKNGQYLRFIFADNSGAESGAGTDIGHWQPGEWHRVTATWGEALATLYVDGKPVGQKTYSGVFQVLPQTQFRIGSNYPGDGPGASGAMSDFKVYRRPVTPDEGGCQ